MAEIILTIISFQSHFKRQLLITKQFRNSYKCQNLEKVCKIAAMDETIKV